MKAALRACAFNGAPQRYKLKLNVSNVQSGNDLGQGSPTDLHYWLKSSSEKLSQTPEFQNPEGGIPLEIGSMLSIGLFSDSNDDLRSSDSEGELHSILGRGNLLVEESVADQIVPVCLWMTRVDADGNDVVNSFESLLLSTIDKNSPSSSFTSACISSGTKRAAEVFLKFCGKKKKVLFDFQICRDVIAADQLAGSSQRTELLRILKLYKDTSLSGRKRSKKKTTSKKVDEVEIDLTRNPAEKLPSDLRALWLLVRNEFSDAFDRMRVLHQKFIKKKAKRLIKEIDKKGAQTLVVKVGSISIDLAREEPKPLSNVPSLANLSTDGMDCNTYQEEKLNASSAGIDEKVPDLNQDGREAFILVHGLQLFSEGQIDVSPANLDNTLLRLESRVISKSIDEKLIVGDMASHEDAFNIFQSATHESVFLPGYGSRSPCSTMLAVMLPDAVEGDENQTAWRLRCDVMPIEPNCKDRTSARSSIGSFSIPIHAFVPDQQQNIAIEMPLKVKDRTEPVSGLLYVSIVVACSTRDRIAHVRANRVSKRPELVQLHLMSLRGPKENFPVFGNRLLAAVSLMDPKQLREFRAANRAKPAPDEITDDSISKCFSKISSVDLVSPEFKFSIDKPRGAYGPCRLTSSIFCNNCHSTLTTGSVPATDDEAILSWSSSVFFPVTRDQRDARVACVELYGCERPKHTAAVRQDAMPFKYLGYVSFDLAPARARSDGGVVELMPQLIIPHGPYTSAAQQSGSNTDLSSVEITALGRQWSGESYGLISPNLLNPLQNLESMWRRRPSLRTPLHTPKSGVSSRASTPLTTSPTESTHKQHSPSKYAVIEEELAPVPRLELPEEFKDEDCLERDSFGQLKSSEITAPDDRSVSGGGSEMQKISESTINGVVALQARARGSTARRKMLSVLMADRRKQKLQRRASEGLRGKMGDVEALGEELLRQQDALAVCVRERDIARRKLRGANAKCKNMEADLEEARQSTLRAEERFEHMEAKLQAAEATLIGCDEMLVEKDKKMAMLESQLSEMKAQQRAGLDRGSNQRSPHLRRGMGLGGGVGKLSPPSVASLQKELESKNIEAERLSAKLEQSERIIKQLIQANSSHHENSRQEKMNALEIASLSISQSSPVLPHHHHRRALLTRLQQEKKGSFNMIYDPDGGSF